MNSIIAINTFARNKMSGEQVRAINSKFVNYSVSVTEMAAAVQYGYSFTCAELITQPDGYCNRKTDNFVRSGIVGVDIDSGKRIEQVMNNKTITENLWLRYTTVSHTEQQHRFRLLFQLPWAVGLTEHSRITDAFVKFFGGDSHCRDSVHLYFGNTDAIQWAYGNTASIDFINYVLQQVNTSVHNSVPVVTAQQVQKKSKYKEWTCKDIRDALICIRLMLTGYEEFPPYEYIQVPCHSQWVKMINALWNRFGWGITPLIAEIFPPKYADEYEQRFKCRMHHISYGSFVWLARLAGYDDSKYRGKRNQK